MKSKEFLIVKNGNTFTIYNEKYEEQDFSDLLLMIKNDFPIFGEIEAERFFIQYDENESSDYLSYHQVHLFQRIKAEQFNTKDCHKLKSIYKCQSCGLTAQLVYTIPGTETQ